MVQTKQLSSAVLGKMLQKYLYCSYAYYILDESVIHDTEYDNIAKILLNNYNKFEHPHKYLVTIDDLEAGTLFRLSDDKYPNMVKGAAKLAIKEYNKRRK